MQGKFFPNFFDCSYFDEIQKAHTFQLLTEGIKGGKAYRKGLYLSNVIENDSESSFHLMRCSTNFKGPTEGFQSIDTNILKKVQEVVNLYYPGPILNHVLAQIYYNDIKKARISKHSDKTKDMVSNGVIAFCTFYSEIPKNDSCLSTLLFRSKDTSKYNDFKVALRPNSLFLIPLEINRLFTHEIVPSQLPSSEIPTRMGYVIRCSKTIATHKNNQTYIGKSPLVPMTDLDYSMLKELYHQENCTTETPIYPELYFSMNQGDYLKPIP